MTVVSRNRKNIFQNSENIIEEELENVAKQIQGLSVDTKIVMPNHVHLILVLENCALPLGEIIRRWKAKVSHSLGYSVWQPNYYEHVIRDEEALNRIREYVIYNPELEILKFEQFYPRDADKSAGYKKMPTPPAEVPHGGTGRVNRWAT
ncbi:MAG: transposase [Candidatus Kerfeldbacteria bacterium]|nr:transposase [Candidatus Kerfeldbacteria bacterium]